METTHSQLMLGRSVQFLYEEHLARTELVALGCTGCERPGDHWGRLVAHVNGNAPRILERSAYIGALDGRDTVYAQLIRPRYQGGAFNRTRSVNQYLTHWIYPYRGKFHPQMVRALYNILGAKPGDVACEPFVGSGTAALEASLLGLRVVGVDISPLCVLLTKVKTTAWMAVDEIRGFVGSALQGDVTRLRLPPDASESLRDFVEVARMVTASDVARRHRDEAASFRKNLDAMLESVTAHADAVKRFALTPGSVTVSVGDARALGNSGIGANSVDVIVTSPPYSIALDYVKNDDHALEAMGIDVPDLRTRMTGVRGRNAHDKLRLYNEDMQAVFHEVARVLKPGARAAFVVGDATVDGREVTTTGTMADWARDAGLAVERVIPKIVFGLYATMQDEQILIFRKE